MQLYLQLLPLLALLPSEALAQYKQAWKYKGSEDIGKYFKFNPLKDPSGGYVNYVDSKDAHKQGMVHQMKNSVRVGPNAKEKYDPNAHNRNSFRLESHKTFGPGLVIADFEHIPAATCGSWPAFWMLGTPPPGQQWPVAGEIDIIEGVNQQPTNQMTLHTTDGCSISQKGYKGIPPQGAATNCISGNGQSGCYIIDRNKNTYGNGFNQPKGGVYAMQWTDSHIAIWSWPRNQIPGNIKNNSPDPSKWGKPSALFHGNCDIKSHFKDMYFILNVDFCGPWAVTNPHGCPAVVDSDTYNQPNCRAYVAKNPDKYKNSYFEINSITYYKRKASQDQNAAEFAAFDQEAPAPVLANETGNGYVGAMGGYGGKPTTRRSLVADFEDVEAEIEERGADVDDVEAEFEERDAEVDDVDFEDVEDLEDF